MDAKILKKKCSRSTDSWNLEVSTIAKNTFNPIRALVDQMKLTPNPEKSMIALSIGDPTVFGNLKPADNVVQAIVDSVKSEKWNGYLPSIGAESARDAVAQYARRENAPLTAKDVILTSGASGALDICITALANPGDNILVPKPGFSLYKTLADSLGIQVRHYNLLPDKGWEVDTNHLISLLDERTAAIVLCNPSNPCGSVYSKKHLETVLGVCEEFKLPVIADEIYADFTFPDQTFHSMASVNQNIPILSCGGLTKRWLIPGWRMGWICINDTQNKFPELRKGLVALSQRILGPNSVTQGALECILMNTPQEFYDSTCQTVARHAKILYDIFLECPGLKPVMPQGAMYMMVGINLSSFPDYKNEVEFTENLVTEQSVFCLPASCFQYPGYFRVVLTVPENKLLEAGNRIRQFCYDHFSKERNGKSS
ncbi:DgyrCDS12239 [Dimorphilus gyrociliatus]|nr:DgyrCDS12239 [Dimorphilus gyrociliatus]